MDFLNWLQSLGADAKPAVEGFQAELGYVLVAVMLPVIFGLMVGLGLRTIERVFGVELGRGGRH